MDLIYADETRKDIGEILDHSLDLAFGTDENNFQCIVSLEDHCCRAGYYLYLEGTEYGGIIDEPEVDTDGGTVAYLGRTWHGILAGKILCPDEGEDYLILSGEANAVLGQLIMRVGLSDLFEAAAENSGINISNYAMNRYVDAYAGIRKMLAASSGKLKMIHTGAKVQLSAVPLVDYSRDEEWDSSQMGFRVSKNINPLNHVICLGKGELAARQVLHLYMDESGNISYEQTLAGIREVAKTYDNPNAESVEELEKGGRELLEDAYKAAEKLATSFDSTQDYDIGDIVGAREEVTGMYVSRPIVKKIVTINRKGINIEHKVGE